MSYFIGLQGAGTGFGSGGTILSQLGQIGPSVRDTTLNGLATQQYLRDFMDRESLRPQEIAAAQERMRLQQLGDYNTAFDIDQSNRAKVIWANTQQTVDQAQNDLKAAGINYDQLHYRTGMANQAPAAAQPSVAARYGSWAGTAPQGGSGYRVGEFVTNGISKLVASPFASKYGYVGTPAQQGVSLYGAPSPNFNEVARAHATNEFAPRMQNMGVVQDTGSAFAPTYNSIDSLW